MKPNSRDSEQLKRIARTVDQMVPDGNGFIIFMFPFNQEGRMRYISNAERESAVAALKEWLIQAGYEETWMRHLP